MRLCPALAAVVALSWSVCVAVASPPTASASSDSPLPTVDLGYQLQRATTFNLTGQYYNFSNIRYAQSPTGNLRFRAPLPPLENRTHVFTGETGVICPQANPIWLLTSSQYIPQYLAGKTNFTPADFNNTAGGVAALAAQDPQTSEDCLFLDVMVPKRIFDRGRNGTDRNGTDRGAPVLVWVYGGGYTAGSKLSSGNPAGLLARSEQNGTDPGVIFVALNYRLGAFGWLAGPTFQENGTANAGLYDQRLAFEWVRKHISRFGGDPDRVTVMGESAGAGSIMHQITAFGGLNGSAPFQQAVLQSPAFQPFVSSVGRETVFRNFLSLLNVSTIAEARDLPYEKLQFANVIQVGLQSSYGTFTYGPAVDGLFAPLLPGQLLAQGRFDKSVKVMVGHNTDEGLLFTSPYIRNNSAFMTEVRKVLIPPVAAFPDVERYISNVLYPPIFNGSHGYTNEIGRASSAVTDSSFACNTFYLDKAYDNQTYAYLFAIPPGLHGEDVPYTFYNGPKASVIDPKIAIAMQEYITHFAEYGTPRERGVPFFPRYMNNATIQVLNITGISQMRDPTAIQRCDWWQKGLYY